MTIKIMRIKLIDKKFQLNNDKKKVNNNYKNKDKS
jgi:hypothetical protein